MVQARVEKWGLTQLNKYLPNNQHFFHIHNEKYVVIAAVTLSFLIGFITTFFIVTHDIYFDISNSDWFASHAILESLIIHGLFIGLEFYLLFQIGFKIAAYYINKAQVTYQIPTDMVQSLCRAVLDLNEPDNNHFNIRPYRKKTNMQKMNMLIYSGKDFLTTFIIKAILKRYISRGTTRLFIPYIGTFITGFWDAFVQAKAIAEIKLRLAARIYLLHLLMSFKQNEPSQALLLSLFRLTAVRLSYKQESDVNLNFLLLELAKKLTLNIDTLISLESPYQLEKSLVDLSHQEKAQFDDIAIHLFSFRRRLTNCEKRLLVRLTNQVSIDTKQPLVTSYGIH